MYKIFEKEILISASVSCMDLMNLRDSMVEAENAGIDFYHFDVVDGHFNNCFILGQTLLEAMRSYTTLPIEVHLAVFEPERYIKQFIKSGADYVGVHFEAMNDPLRIMNMVRKFGAEPVLTYRAETEFEDAMLPLFKHAAWINKLTVNPGYAGQKMQASALDHIRKMRDALLREKWKLHIQADGNINPSTIPSVMQAGASILTGGTSGLFMKGQNIEDNFNSMLNIAVSHQRNNQIEKARL